MKNMKLKRGFLFLLTMFLFTFCANAQIREITGTLTDENNQGLPGATILIKGTANGATTDSYGNYSINVPQDSTLVFSYVGYLSEEVKITDQSEVNISFIPDITDFGEVVVVGYGVQKKSLVTGSIAKVKAKDIVSTPSLRIEQALQGRTSGVVYNQTSGNPGTQITVRIRGISSNSNSEPLYIVDGLKTSKYVLNEIDPSDIESVEVLKDAASAAIYGSQGANGVIIITTKSGTAKKNHTEIVYDAYYGIQMAKPVEVMSAEQYREYFAEAYAYNNITEGDDNQVFQEYKENAYRQGSRFFPFVGAIDTLSEGTNWMNEVFQTAPMQKHHLSMNTSSENTSLYLGISYYTQDGVVGGAKNNFNHYNLTMIADHQANDWLKIGTHLILGQSKSRNLPTNDIYNNVVLSAMSFDPTVEAYWNNASEIPEVFRPLTDSLLQASDGRYYSISNVTVGERVNPLAKIEVEQNNKTLTNRALGNIYAEIKPFKDLTYRFSYNAELSYVTLDNWQPKFYYTGEFANQHSFVSKEIQQYYKSQVDNVLTYKKVLNNNSINLMVGQSYEKYTGSSVRARRNDLFIENNNFNIIDDTPLTSENVALQQTGGFRDITAMISYFGRLNYNYKEKYLLSVTIRRDGSSMFEKNHRFGTFPSISVGWNLNRENFFKITSVSMLKIRASWGQNGSISNVEPYMWISTTTAENGGRQVVKNATFNKDLTWETSEQSNFGLDMGLFENKVTFSCDYFIKMTKDLLAKPEVVSWTVGEIPFYNVGNVLNTGVEFDLGYSNHDNTFKYDVNLIASYLKNKVTDFEAALLPGYVLFSGRQHTVFEEGQPAWYFQGYQVDGIFQSWEEVNNYTFTDPNTGVESLIQPDAQPGDPIIRDIAGGYDSQGNPLPDGAITTADYTYLGKPLPTWTFGLNFNCQYKGFDAGIFLYSEIDKTIFNALTRDDRTYYNRPARFYTERWTESNHTNEFIRATFENTGGYAFGHNSLFFEDGSFLRIKNVQLGYTIPENVLQKIKLSKIRIYLSVNNLYTLTNYSGSDPEVGQTQENNYYSYGVDMGFYPSAKQYLAGVTVTF